MDWTPGTDDLRALWTLDPAVTFLNHGSFGAAPRVVIEAQARWIAEMEREPVHLLARRLPALLEEVRAAVGAFVGSEPAGIVLVPNATTGVNAVLRSLDFAPGDEIVCADQSYNAVLQAVRYVAARTGAGLVKAALPLSGPASAYAEAFAAVMTPRTRLLVVDHIASATGLVLPVEALVALARDRGVPILVDGAHGPGSVPLALDALGADFYTGNLHKWAYAAKGSAFLHVAPSWRPRVHPVTISHGYTFGLQPEFDWVGTVDPSPWLSIPDALAFHARFPDLHRKLHALVRYGLGQLEIALGVAGPVRERFGPMAIVPWPHARFGGAFAQLNDLTARLYAEHRIEAPFMAFDERIWLRVSAQVYNRPSDYDHLARVLAEGWR